jgi:protein-tyrosine phosphatase
VCEEAGVAHRFDIDSAGTGGWHQGSPPDSRAQAAALQRGVDISALRARQVCREDFYAFDYLLAMDQSNLADLMSMRPDTATAKVALFLDFAPDEVVNEVPDPYYGGDAGFEEVLDLTTAAARGFLAHLVGPH